MRPLHVSEDVGGNNVGYTLRSRIDTGPRASNRNSSDELCGREQVSIRMLPDDLNQDACGRSQGFKPWSYVGSVASAGLLLAM